MKNVMLIHGFNGVPKIYEYFKDVLSEKGYNVIIPEFPTRTDITIDGFFQVFEKYKNYFNNDKFASYINKRNRSYGQKEWIRNITSSNRNY